MGQKAEENAALDEIADRKGGEDQERNQDVQGALQETCEAKLLQKIIIFSKKMTFTFPGQ